MSTEMSKQTILIVDDMAENIDVLKAILIDDYKVKFAINGEKAIENSLLGFPARPDSSGYHDAGNGRL